MRSAVGTFRYTHLRSTVTGPEPLRVAGRARAALHAGASRAVSTAAPFESSSPYTKRLLRWKAGITKVASAGSQNVVCKVGGIQVRSRRKAP